MNQLSIAEIRTLAPQAFAETAKPGVSQKYSFLPTSRIIEDMDKLGWKVSAAKAGKYRNIDNQAYGNHFVAFFHPEIFIKDAQGEIEAYPQVVVFNSHTGRGSFRFEMGIFRLVCSNGMVIKSSDMGSFQLKHTGYTFEELQHLVTAAVERMPEIAGKINTFGQRLMNSAEQRAFATSAFALRSDRQLTENELVDFLTPRRKEDEGDSLWLVLNRIQESVIKGGSLAEPKAKKGKKAFKGIKNIHRDFKINQQLWEMAETYC
jgi:hypothetical protein